MSSKHRTSVHQALSTPAKNEAKQTSSMIKEKGAEKEDIKDGVTKLMEE